MVYLFVLFMRFCCCFFSGLPEVDAEDKLETDNAVDPISGISIFGKLELSVIIYKFINYFLF
jgi:hypothetical protein